jgi:hypothetical protein
MPITLAWGLCRLSPNLIWYGDFASQQQSAQGGKGGGGGKGSGQYDYTAAVIMALCQGVAPAIQRIWVDSDKTSTLTKLNLTLFTGTHGQAPWDYLVTNHPTEALAYPDLAYLASTKYDLGSSAALPQHSFETECRLYNTAPGGLGDADVALVIQDYMTVPIWGAGFPSAELDTVSLLSSGSAGTTGDAATETYCTAMGFGMSPNLSSQENGLSILKRWCDIFNIAPVWNGEMMKFIPYSLEGVSGNGVIFVPNTTSAFSLTDADYVGNPQSPDDPVLVKRQDWTQVKNRLQMEISDRQDKEYNAVPIEYVEQGLVDLYGDLQDSVFTAHEVCEKSVATKCVQIMVQRNAYRGANTYTFKLGPAHCLLEPMDLLDVMDPQLGLVQVQIDNLDEDSDFNVTYTCSQISVAASNAGGFSNPDQTPGGNDTGVDPGSVNTPIIFEPPSSLAGPTAQVWAAISGASPNWGGCNVLISTDGTSYVEIGTQNSKARMGLTTTALAAYGGTNPDTTHSVGVDLTQSSGTLVGVTAADAATYASLSYLGGEFISYEDALFTSTYHYTLQTQLYRGLYGSSPASHLSGVPFARLDDNIFKYNLPSQYIGKTLYFKFQSFNIFGQAFQDLSTCTAYTLTVAGTGFGTGSGGLPATPTGLAGSAGAGFAKLTWNANSANDNVKNYEVWRAAGPSGSFGSATRIGTPAGTTFTDTSGAYGVVYTYFVVAVNAVGSSGATSGVDLTATQPSTTQPFGFAFGPKVPTASKIVGAFDSPIAWTMPASLTNSEGRIIDSDSVTAVAPTSQTDFDIQSPVGTSIATMRFAASSLTATFINTVGDSVAIGSTVYIVAPSNLNGLAGAIIGSILGTRP